MGITETQTEIGHDMRAPTKLQAYRYVETILDRSLGEFAYSFDGGEEVVIDDYDNHEDFRFYRVYFHTDGEAHAFDVWFEDGGLYGEW